MLGKPAGGGHFAREEGSMNGAGWRDQQAGGPQVVKNTQHRLHADEVAQRRALGRHILSQTSQMRCFAPAEQDGSGTNSILGDHSGANAAAAAAAAAPAHGNNVAPTYLSPTLTSPHGEAGSASASGTSVGSGGTICTAGSKKKRERIATTPVWKRPVVPLSKPYVPVPRKG